MLSDKRFVKYHDGPNSFGVINEIWVDTMTGVQYYFHIAGYGAGLTPLLDATGKPLIAEEYRQAE